MTNSDRIRKLPPQMRLLPCYCTWSKIKRRKVLLPLKQLKHRIGGIAHTTREGELALWCWVLLEYCEKQCEGVNLWQRGRVKCRNSSCPYVSAVINSPSCFVLRPRELQHAGCFLWHVSLQKAVVLPVLPCQHYQALCVFQPAKHQILQSWVRWPQITGDQGSSFLGQFLQRYHQSCLSAPPGNWAERSVKPAWGAGLLHGRGGLDCDVLLSSFAMFSA